MTAAQLVRTKPRVFLSFALEDRLMAAEVARVLSSSGIRVVSMGDAETGNEYTDSVRRALGSSAAVVAVLSGISKRRDIPASILFEIGAAVGAGKPIRSEEHTSELQSLAYLVCR